MPADLILQQTPDTAVLLEKRQHLAAVRGSLAEREAQLARLRAELRVFEARYLRQVGVLYAELDAIDARIAEREVDLYDSESARRRAREARQRAQETHDAAFRSAEDEEPVEVEAPPDLKRLFREVARRIHPDLAADPDEQAFLTLLMIRANQAYSRADFDTLQRLLDDHLEVHALDAEEGTAAELGRVTRQIRHAERDLVALATEQEKLLASEIGQLHVEANAAAGEDRDLLAELAATLREQIVEAERRFTLIDRQIGAHGR